MKEFAIVEKSKEILNKASYKIKYGRKFKKFNIDKSFSDVLIERKDKSEGKEIFNIINKSRSKKEFSNNVNDYLKTRSINPFASTLLIGNVTGKYVFNGCYYGSIKRLNVDAFSKENRDLLPDLRSHFYEYVINNNKVKNIFAKTIKNGEDNIKDLSQDIVKENVDEDFYNFFIGEKLYDIDYKPEQIMEYIMQIIGTYSREDIKNNFNFILYDIKNKKSISLDERRKKYFAHKKLSNNQIRKIDEVEILKNRLSSIKGDEAKFLLDRLSKIENNLDENISNLEDIYTEYEILFRQDLINNLYVPNDEITIIENFNDMKPQLIHQFIRSTEKFRDTEIDKIKKKIIADRRNGDNSKILTDEENKRLDNMKNQMEANLDQFKVNYTIDGKETIYTDPIFGIDTYHSDTTNQISAAIFDGKSFINYRNLGIIGIGFNNETLIPEAIAISANSYKTTNKGLNNIEYDETIEFKEISAPFSELIKANGNSEIVMHRRGIDFDTKASYIFALIDSSNKNQTEEIMNEIEEVREKENLKAVVYDVYKLKKSYEKMIEEGIEER